MFISPKQASYVAVTAVTSLGVGVGIAYLTKQLTYKLYQTGYKWYYKKSPSVATTNKVDLALNIVSLMVSYGALMYFGNYCMGSAPTTPLTLRSSILDPIPPQNPRPIEETSSKVSQAVDSSLLKELATFILDPFNDDGGYQP